MFCIVNTAFTGLYEMTGQIAADRDHIITFSSLILHTQGTINDNYEKDF